MSADEKPEMDSGIDSEVESPRINKPGPEFEPRVRDAERIDAGVYHCGWPFGWLCAS